MHFVALAGRDGTQIAVDLRPCGSGWSARCICGATPKEKVAVDLHLVVLAERTLYLCRSSKEKVVVDLHLVVLAGRNEFHT